MRIILIGRGKMGTLIRETAAAAGDEIEAVFGRDDLGQLGRLGRVADVVMDFSRPEALPEVASYVRRTGTPLLSGNTGYGGGEGEGLFALGSAAPVLWSANYSLGWRCWPRPCKVIAPVLGPDFDIEITETHHSQKADAPSGTAKLLLEAVDPQHRLRPVYGREGNCGRREKDEVGIHALRGGTVAGTHTVHFFGPDEELELTHRCQPPDLCERGPAHRLPGLLPGRPKGVYDLQKNLVWSVMAECTGNQQLYRRFPKDPSKDLRQPVGSGGLPDPLKCSVRRAASSLGTGPSWRPSWRTTGRRSPTAWWRTTAGTPACPCWT